MSLPTLKAFIFDMDGTLVDSKLDFDSMREELSFPKGIPLLEHIEELKAHVSAERIQYFYDVIHQYEMEGAKASELMPGVSEFLSYLNKEGIKTAVVTRNNKIVTDITFKKCALEFEMVLTRDCVENPKPHPEGLLTICDEFGIDQQEAVYMGDFSFDLLAAKNANMKAILYSPSIKNDLETMADLTVRCFNNLRNNFSEEFLRPLGFSTSL